MRNKYCSACWSTFTKAPAWLTLCRNRTNKRNYAAFKVGSSFPNALVCWSASITRQGLPWNKAHKFFESWKTFWRFVVNSTKVCLKYSFTMNPHGRTQPCIDDFETFWSKKRGRRRWGLMGFFLKGCNVFLKTQIFTICSWKFKNKCCI